MKHLRFLRFAAVVLAAVASLVSLPTLAQKPSPQRVAMQGFMRQKLAASQGLLEGLTLERFPQVQKSALVLRKMTQTNAWSSSKNVMYQEAMTNYQANLDQLWAAASENNLNLAVAAYTRVTHNCVDCHRIVRAEQVPQLKP